MQIECCKPNFTKNVVFVRFGCDLLRIRIISRIESFLLGTLFNESLCTIQRKIFFQQLVNQHQNWCPKPSLGTLEAWLLIPLLQEVVIQVQNLFFLKLMHFLRFLKEVAGKTLKLYGILAVFVWFHKILYFKFH